MRSFSSETRQLAQGLGLLAGLVAGSVLLFAFQSWLRASGGWALLVLGTVCLWSAALAALTALRERRRLERERAIDAALDSLRRAIAAAGRDEGEER